MRIESGISGQKRNRLLITMLVCAVFMGWFAYDGWVKYPQENEAKRVAGAENVPHTDTDIRLQKLIAGILAVVFAGTVVSFLWVNSARTVLDEPGLTVKGRQIGWDQMAELDAAQLGQKGWVSLVLADGESVRLDSYEIALFEDVIDAICSRKGFVNPLDRVDEPGETPAGA